MWTDAFFRSNGDVRRWVRIGAAILVLVALFVIPGCATGTRIQSHGPLVERHTEREAPGFREATRELTPPMAEFLMKMQNLQNNATRIGFWDCLRLGICPSAGYGGYYGGGYAVTQAYHPPRRY